MSPVLIFDQFEEFFAFYPPEKRKAFIKELADLVRNRIPAERRQSVTSEKPFLNSETPPDVKILISIREDYLGLLEEMADDIPQIFENRFRLLPLTREQAIKAIVKPAELKDERIQSPVFRYEDEALETILEYLCKRKERDGIKIVNEVEPFQLQLICRHIENGIAKKSDRQNEFVVKKEDVNNLPDVLQKFYEDQLNQLGKKDKKNITRLCEKSLISVTDRRLSIEQEEIERNFKVSKTVLEKLVDSRLLRAESRVGSVYYELSHDTLIEPIRYIYNRKNKILKIIISICCIPIIFIYVFSLYYLYYMGYHSKNINDSIMKLTSDARIMFLQKSYEEAIKKYKEAIQIAPQKAYLYSDLGDVYSHFSQYEEADTAYSKAIEIEQNDLQKVKYGVKKLTNEAKSLFIRKEIEKTIKLYEKAIKIAPQEVSLYSDLGDVYSDFNQYQEAAAAYRKFIEFNPKNSIGYYKLGSMYEELKDYDEAIQMYSKSIELDPKYGNYFHLEYLYKHLNRYNEAVEMYRKAIEIDTGNAQNYKNLGELYKELKCYDEAVEMYCKLIEIVPKDEYYRELDYLYNDLKLYDKAIEMYQKFIELNPKTTWGYNRLGDLYKRLKYYNKAVEMYQKIIELDPENALNYNKFAELFKELKLYNKAVEMYRKSIELNPKYPLTKMHLAEAIILMDDITKALPVLDEVLKEKYMLPDWIMGNSFNIVCALMIERKRTEAIDKLNILIQHHQSLPEYYEREWNYEPMKNFITNHKTLAEKDKVLLLKVADALESPKAEADTKLKEIAAEIDK